MMAKTTTNLSTEQALNLDYSSEARRWQALEQRSPQADGAFVYGVLSTHIYCRPSCPSRKPRPENVRFFDTCEQAEQAGFRACKRCQPRSARQDIENEAAHVAAIIQACHTLAAAEKPPSLKELAQSANLSPYHFQRVFKRVVGVSPKQYAMEQRMKRVQAGLQPGATVTQAMLEAGFRSSGRFYQETGGRLGMKPSIYKNGASGLQIRYALAQSYLGWVLVASTEKGICAIQFGDEPDGLIQTLQERFPGAELSEHDASFEDSLQKVLRFLEAPRQPVDVPLDIQGTAFQRRVWQALQEIPAGSTLSYASVAARIGQPTAARAVAHACAANKIAAVIPCHRVVRADGGLGGYRWGLGRKRALLEREKS